MLDTTLQNYITKQDYENFAGKDWPRYENFLQGEKSQIPAVQEEIDNFVAMMKLDGIKFPIDTKTACQSKWTWSTIYLNQLSTASCHRVNLIKFSLEDFDNFHNVPKKLEDRRLMLKGEWPTGGCEYCRVLEEAGGHSDRQHNLQIRNLTPPEVLADPTAVRVSPKIVEIFAQNTCNLACTYCNSNLSSKIEHENKKFGEFNVKGVNIPVTQVPQTTKQYFDKFLDWLDRNIQTLVRLHLLGGETFIQHDLMNSVLDIIKRKPNPNLEFCIFSNFNVPDRYWDLYINQIKDLQQKQHIRVFDLTASIDCWGAEAEYVRSGLDLKKFEQRFAWASEQGDWLRLNANQTVTALTMQTMPELIEKIDQYSQHKNIGHYFEFYIGDHMFQHPKTYAYSTWSETFDRIFKAMPNRTSSQQEAILRMQGLQKYLQTFPTHNWEEIEKLHVYLDELDRRRSTDWRKIFAYLDISK
jgi:organic radical activating enzyme